MDKIMHERTLPLASRERTSRVSGGLTTWMTVLIRKLISSAKDFLGVIETVFEGKDAACNSAQAKRHSN